MFVYTVTKKSTIDNIFIHGWSRQFAGDAEGVDYGVGVYGNINYPYQEDKTPYPSKVRFSHNPSANCIIKSKVDNLYGFLLFDEYFAKQTYGENHSIKDQVYRILPKGAADSLWKDMQWYMTKDTSPEGNGNHMRGRTSGLLQYMMSKNLYPAKLYANPEKFEAIFGKYNIRGAIYFGRGDKLCIVVYNYDEIIPIAYSVDGGHHYTYKKAERTYPDSVRKMAHLFSYVDYPVEVTDNDGQRFYFSRVKVKPSKPGDGEKWNMIDAKTGEKISPIDFDSITTINADTGMFQVEYRGKFYDACPGGIFLDMDDPENSFVDFSEIGNLRESARKCIRTMINEDFQEGVKYGDYPFPTQEQLRNPHFPCIYKVINKRFVDGAFKISWERELCGDKGKAFGSGLYASLSFDIAKTLIGPVFGHTILQFKVVGGFDRYLVFNVPEWEKKLYGRRIYPYEQLLTFLPEHIVKKVSREAGIAPGSYGVNFDALGEIAGKYKIRGSIFPYGVGPAVLPYDFSSCIPYAYWREGDNNNKFKVGYNDETEDRFLTSIDTVWRYGHKYRVVEKAIAGYNESGGRTGYSRVQKYNGNWNIIDIQNGREISPYDFEITEPVNPEDGSFRFEYGGKNYFGWVGGFFPIPDNYDIELPFEKLDDCAKGKMSMEDLQKYAQ